MTLQLGTGGSISSTSTVVLVQRLDQHRIHAGCRHNAVSTTIGGLTTSGTGSASDAVVGGNSSVSTLTINNSSADSFAGTLGGTGTNQNQLALKMSGTSTLTLSGNNTYAGGTMFNNGILNVASTGALGSSGNLVFTGGTLQLSTANNTTDYSSRIVSAVRPRLASIPTARTSPSPARWPLPASGRLEQSWAWGR